MPIRICLENQAVEADTPEELYRFLEMTALLTSVAVQLHMRQADYLADAPRASPSVSQLRLFWQRLGSNSQRAVVRYLAAYHSGVASDRLKEVLGVSSDKALAGVFSGLAKNAKVAGFDWTSSVLNADGFVRFRPEFNLNLREALGREGLNPYAALDLHLLQDPAAESELDRLEQDYEAEHEIHDDF